MYLKATKYGWTEFERTSFCRLLLYFSSTSVLRGEKQHIFNILYHCIANMHMFCLTFRIKQLQGISKSISINNSSKSIL